MVAWEIGRYGFVARELLPSVTYNIVMLASSPSLLPTIQIKNLFDKCCGGIL